MWYFCFLSLKSLHGVYGEPCNYWFLKMKNNNFQYMEFGFHKFFFTLIPSEKQYYEF